ncbi:MAG: hypothetical protein PHR62_10205 [Paludibacter sp.]|nr:hypothetical protein [Paludibacter sp.]
MTQIADLINSNPFVTIIASWTLSICAILISYFSFRLSKNAIQMERAKINLEYEYSFAIIEQVYIELNNMATKSSLTLTIENLRADLQILQNIATVIDTNKEKLKNAFILPRLYFDLLYRTRRCIEITERAIKSNNPPIEDMLLIKKEIGFLYLSAYMMSPSFKPKYHFSDLNIESFGLPKLIDSYMNLVFDLDYKRNT